MKYLKKISNIIEITKHDYDVIYLLNGLIISKDAEPLDISYNVNISSLGYTTFYTDITSIKLPYNVEGYVAYVDSNNSFFFKKEYNGGEIVPKDTAIVLKGTQGSYILESALGGPSL